MPHSAGPSHCQHFWNAGPFGLTGSKWLYARSSWVVSHCHHSHNPPVGLTGCEWLHARYHWVHYCHSCFCFSIGLTVCEWFYARSIMFLLNIITFALVLLAFQKVSDLMSAMIWLVFLFLFPPPPQDVCNFVSTTIWLHWLPLCAIHLYQQVRSNPTLNFNLSIMHLGC